MGLSDNVRSALFAALERQGWSWDGDYVYAPNKTMWLLRESPWRGDLAEFHDRMVRRAERIAGKLPYDDSLANRHASEDTKGLVSAIENMLKAHGET